MNVTIKLSEFIINNNTGRKYSELDIRKIIDDFKSGKCKNRLLFISTNGFKPKGGSSEVYKNGINKKN